MLDQKQMKLDFDQNNSIPVISEYSEQGIVVGTQCVCEPFVACGEEIITDLLPNNVAELSEAVIETIVGRNVDIIILGTGRQQVFPDATILLPALKCAVGVEVMETGAACRSYNVLVGEGRKIAGLFYPLVES